LEDIPSVSEFSRSATLRDGGEITIRRLCSGDKPELLSMFNCLSKETKFLRYHYVKLFLSDEEAETYCNFDGTSGLAIIAEKPHLNSKRIVGVGRFDRIGSTSTAEISFIVDDLEQGKGICTFLLADLTKLARKLGIARFVGLLTNENVIMLDILKKTAPGLSIEVDGGDILISFDI
jgi:hypothetical protein